MFKELNNTYSLVSKTDLIYDNGYYTIGNACLKGNTLIKTSQGNKNINILKIGDYLSNNNKVEKIVRHNRNYYYRIILNNNDVIEASNDHRFILLNKEIKTTEQLKINDYENKFAKNDSMDNCFARNQYYDDKFCKPRL